MKQPIDELGRTLVAYLPADIIRTDGSTRERFAFGRVRPGIVVSPKSEDELALAVQLCGAWEAALVPWGQGARQWQVPPPWRYDVALDLAGLNRVVAYEPDDLTVTVQAGCAVETLAAVLAPHRQWLPLDVAVPSRSTVGGILASAALGWERSGQLSTRDLLLGVTWVTANGEVVHGGGRVVKNVAGYDLMRLLTGSWGTLGIITQVTWKLLPEPEAKEVGWASCSSWAEALEYALAGQAERPEPKALAVVAFPTSAKLGEGERVGVLVAYAGAAEEVRGGKANFERKVRHVRWFADDIANTPWVCRVRDFSLVGVARPWQAGFRLALLPDDLAPCAEYLASLLDERNAGICVWPQRGAVYVRFTEDAEERYVQSAFLQAFTFARERRGWAWPDFWSQRWEFAVPELPHLYLSRRVKEALDPKGILSPGRYWRHW